jgi:hypothetical protein
MIFTFFLVTSDVPLVLQYYAYIIGASRKMERECDPYA